MADIVLTFFKQAVIWHSSQDLARFHIDQWVDWSNSIDDCNFFVLYPLLGYYPYDEAR